MRIRDISPIIYKIQSITASFCAARYLLHPDSGEDDRVRREGAGAGAVATTLNGEFTFWILATNISFFLQAYADSRKATDTVDT